MRPTLLSSRPRALAMLVVTTLLAGLLAVVAFAQPVAAAASAMTVAVKADGSVLNGDQASVTITASNPASAATPLYNLGYSYVLPAGVSYVAGSAGKQTGDPVVTTRTAEQGGGTLLVWSNISDLVVGDAKSITFQVKSTDAAFPVGSSFTGTAQVAASSDARNVPTFDATGAPATKFTDSATSEVASTAVSALKITKDEPSSEHELVRGVHQRPTVYTLTVTNTQQDATNGVTVTDYLPAGLEYLQCGAVEHTTSGPEYDGAPALDRTTVAASALTDCVTPVSVETVRGAPGLSDTAVYTKVTWSLGDLAKGAERTIQYVAAVPLRENTLDFSGQPGKAATAAQPSAASLGQGANLDNNNGASTRQDTGGETSNGQGQTNTAVATGAYQGRDDAGTIGSTQTAQTKLTVEAMDLAVAKTASVGTFTAGQQVRYTLTVRTSEYDSSHDITLQDVLGDGLCPVVPAGTPTTGTLPADCDPAKVPSMAGDATGATITGVDYDAATGRFTVHFSLADQAEGSAPATIGYSALMRTAYSSRLNGGPTAAGDDFTNTVTMAGTSTGVHGDTDERAVRDDSSVTITSGEPEIEKKVLPVGQSAGVTDASSCADPSRTGSYTTDAPGAFSLGDVVCFQLAVTFPAGVQSRNATITDMLPVGTSAAGTTWQEGRDWAWGTSDVPRSDVALKRSDERTATFTVGQSIDRTGSTYVDADAAKRTLLLYVAATIDTAGASTDAVDIVDNLMKFAQQNTAGTVTSLRSAAGYDVAGAPTATLAKDIVATGPSASALTADVNPRTTTEGRALQYRLTVGNDPAEGSDRAISGVTVWDALPAGITCDDVEETSLTNDGRCVDAPDGVPTKYQGRDYITWTLPEIAAGESVALTYVLDVPENAYVGTAYRNDASVTRFTTATNSGATTTWIPETGPDSVFQGAAGDGEGTAPNADAQRSIAIPSATVDKTATPTTAVPGQRVGYTYSVTVPAGTTVGKGSLVDPLAGISGLATTDDTTWELTLPGGTSATTDAGPSTPDATVEYAPSAQTFTLTGTNDTANGPGAVLFPTTFDNTGTTDLVFSVTVRDLVATAGTGVHRKDDQQPIADVPLRNTATFSSTDARTDRVTTASDDATVTVQAPNVVVTKTDDRAGRPVSGGETITYTLTARNSSTTTTARSVIVADCFPDTLVFGTSTAGVIDPVPSAVADLAQCGSGTTLHAWTVGELAPGASAVVTVTGTLAAQAPAGRTYSNTARAISSSLVTDYRDTDSTYVQVASAKDDIAVASPTITKQLTAPNWDATTGVATTPSRTTNPANTTAVPVRPGDSAVYTITATVPAKVALYAPTVTDSLPSGMRADVQGIRAVWNDGSDAAVSTGPSTATSLTLTFPDVASAAAARTLTITVPVTLVTTATAGSNQSNTAKLTWDRNSTTSTTRDTTSVSPANPANATVVAPALTITKAALVGGAAAAKVEPGTDYQYRVVVENTGTAPAYDVAVTDCVPKGVVVTGTDQTATLDTAAAGCSGTKIAWTARTIAAKAKVTLTYPARLAADDELTGGSLTNTAATGTYSSLPNAADGSDAGRQYASRSASATVTPSFPKVDVTKTIGAGLAYVGQESSFTVRFQNTGGRATKVEAIDTLPANWTYTANSARASVNGGTATAVEPSISGRTLAWTNLGALPANGTLVVTYRATPTSAATDDPGRGTAVLHTNSVTSTVTDPSTGTSYDGGNGKFVSYEGSTTKTAATASATIAAADLAVDKRATEQPVVAGSTTDAAWTVRVTNTGDDTARGTTVIESPDLPAGASVTFSGSGWVCTPTGDTWSCANPATVAKGSSFPDLVIALTLPANAPLAAVVNTATIRQATGQTFDPNPANNEDSASVTPVAVADLAITKTANTATGDVRAGTEISWGLSVENRKDASVGSTSDAHGTVTVTDRVPETVRDVRVTASTDSGWTCRVDGQDVTCERDGLASGVTVGGITVSGTVRSDVRTGTDVVNRATVAVDRSTTDPVSENDEDETTTAVDDTTMLSVTKQFDGELVAGEDAAWRITVRNTGTADARDVVVRDSLESGTALVDGAYRADGWTCTGSTTVECVLDGTLAAGSDTEIVLPVSTPSSLTGDLHNEASVAWTNRPTGMPDQTDEASSAAAGQTVGLRVQKVPGAESVDAGRDLSYTITVSNPSGPSDLPAGDTDTPSIRVVDQLPTGLDYVGISDASAAHWTVESTTGGTIVLTSTDALAKGATATPIVLAVRVPADHVPGTTTNHVEATPKTALGDAAEADADVDVTTHADLSVTKQRTSAATADAGTRVTYDVTVHNDGPSDAQRVTWQDTAPAGMTVTAVTTDDAGWEQRADDPTTWTTGTLPSGATGTFHVTAAIASGTPAGTLRNTASVSSATDDTDPTNDTAGDDVGVTTHATLTVTKTPVAEAGSTERAKRVTAGAEQVWLVQVRNEGPSDEQPTTTVTDVLPDGLTFVGATSTGSAWTCDGTSDPGAVVCDLSSTIVAGDDAPALWITTKVASGYTASEIVNQARITGQGTTPTPGTTGEATSPLEVDEDANVQITIDHDGTAVIGQDLPETVQVRNAGLSDARAVTATYTLPKGLTYVSTEADPAWTVTGVTRNADGSTTVSFALAGTLPAGALAPVITVHQTPTAEAYPGVRPSATVATETTETTLADNQADDALAVDPAASLSITKTHLGTLVRGKTVGYTITVRNDGPTEDPGPVVVTDRLPEGLSLVSVNDGEAATCTTGTTVTCTLSGALAVDAAVTFQVTAKVAEDAPDRITNVAEVTSPTTQVTPVGPGSDTADPTDPTRAVDPAPVHAAPAAEDELAFTGAAGLGIGLLIAVLAMTLGGVLLVTRRRRRA